MTSLLNLTNQVNSLTTTINNQATQIANLQTAVNSLTNNFKNLNGQILEDLNQNIRIFFGLITSFDIQDNSTIVYTVQNGYDQMTAAMSTLYNKIETEITNLNNMVIQTNVNP